MDKNQIVKKEYVSVIVKHDADGNIRPLAIGLNDNLYEIDKVKQKCRAASLKVGGTGIRYTVVINGHIIFLYDEENGKWFLDSKVA